MNTKEQIINIINDNSFYKIYSRNSSVYVSECFGFYAKEYLKNSYGVHWDEIAVNENEFVDVYGIKDQKDIVSATIRKRLISSVGIQDFYEDFALPYFHAYREITKKMAEKYRDQSLNFDEILADFKEFSVVYAQFIAQNYFIFFTDEPLNDFLAEELKNTFPNKSAAEISDIIQIISTPLEKTAVVLERISFLKLKLAEFKGKPDFEKQLLEHTKNYNWFPIYNPSDSAHSVDYYRTYLRDFDVDDAKHELNHILEEQEVHKNLYTNFISSLSNQSLKKLIEITNKVSFYREYRNDIRREGLRDIQGLFRSIANILGISVKELCHMQREEIIHSLTHHSLILDKKLLNDRILSFLVLFTQSASRIIDDKDIIADCKQLIKNKNSTSTSLTGAIGSKGFATGTAVVIDNINRLSEVKEGDILVASMTAPDYVPAMRMAAAVVTDEGGITCHAAVIARELNKPCIIGTKSATQIIKTGDVVEVDADNGIVTILEKYES